jgi:hypothetical protein
MRYLLNAYHSRSVYAKYRFQISSQKSATLTLVFHGFPKTLHANAGIVFLDHDAPLPENLLRNQTIAISEMKLAT